VWRTKQYWYDGEGERISRRRFDPSTGTATYYFGGVYEEDFNLTTGQLLAQRYLYQFNGQVVSQQEHDPWGKVRTGGIGHTTLNYTGQRLDGTGLLYYHARYYDPGLARFISPDSIVPGASLGAGGAPGTVGQEQNSLLTVDFHEGALLSGLNSDNALILQKGYWFQLSGQDRRQRQAREPWGPQNPQALSRYAYVLGNPLRYVDPTGHTWYLTHAEAAQLVAELRQLASAIRTWSTLPNTLGWASALLNSLVEKYRELHSLSRGSTVMSAVMLFAYAEMVLIAWNLDMLADLIEKMNKNSANGVAIAYYPSVVGAPSILVMNLDTGETDSLEVYYALIPFLDRSLERGRRGSRGSAYHHIWTGWHFYDDEAAYGPPSQKRNGCLARNARTNECK
jgi:RHS repeat-associated protein